MDIPLGVLDGMGIEPQMAHHDVYKYVHAPTEVISIQTFMSNNIWFIKSQ
ncbi:MAG: hypothetical protein CM15mP83_5080 [Flavobacteriaceae bacterium]|nr:MAG: hypothetical protein CM15mP83_5080 [Flavobacteriaceae bacterium]